MSFGSPFVSTGLFAMAWAALFGVGTYWMYVGRRAWPGLVLMGFSVFVVPVVAASYMTP